MKKLEVNSKSQQRRLYLLGLLLILFIVLIAKSLAAQSVSTNTRYPLLKEGKLFTITVTPRSNKAEVHVAGSKIADFKFEEVGLVARVRIGNEIKVLSSKRGNQNFVLGPLPQGASSLELNLKHKNQEERFDVDLQQP